MAGGQIVEVRARSATPDRLVIGGVVATAGSLLGMIGNLVHPETPIDDPAGTR